MSRWILALYRSAPEPNLEQMAAHLPEASAVTGLVGLPLAHWWMVQNPKLAAETLTNFWSSVPTADAHV